ncbi:shikimate dehydrogenase [Candidatus Peregrinibacteria bacterium]|nr:shikimate dehydrogenase [Candidatus Peregrinibacteria bacterium]
MNKIYGIVGHPVAHSLSPAMHNAAIRHLKIDAEYRLFDIDPDHPDDLANFCYETDLNNIGGFSVTMPYKEEIMAYMDHYDPLAKIVGSVNTVVNENSKLIGYNTDAAGSMQALRKKTDISGKKALVMGAGGAAKAIVYSLKEYGADVFIFNRTQEKAEALADEFDVETIEFRQIPQANFDIIVNATPVGSLPRCEETLLNAGQIPSHAVVMDLITCPIETQLLKEAEKASATPISGERMLLHQAVGQFELWFGKKAPVEVMEKALYEALEKRQS